MMASESFSSSASDAACACASLTWSVAGISGSIARTSWAGVVPSFAATEIESKRPSRLNRDWAVSTSHAAMLAKPSESTLPNETVPLSLYVCFLPSVDTTTLSPIA